MPKGKEQLHTTVFVFWQTQVTACHARVREGGEEREKEETEDREEGGGRGLKCEFQYI